jgi:hypothetical protein
MLAANSNRLIKPLNLKPIDNFISKPKEDHKLAHFHN